MKIKLIAIALMALLVLTIVPMTATASQGTTRVIYPVYLQGTNDPVGQITIGHNTGHGYGFMLAAVLTPGTTYLMRVTVGTNFVYYGPATVREHGNGHVHIHGTLSITDAQYNAIKDGTGVRFDLLAM